MTRITLAWVSGEVAIKLRSDDPDAFTSLIDALKDYVAPHLRRYDPRLRQWFINSAAFHDIGLWTEGAKITFDARVEWSTTKTPGGQSSGSKRADKPHTPAKAESYAALYLLPNAPVEVIKASYRALAQLHHPDHGGSTEAMQKLNKAFAVLEARLPN